MSSVSWIAQERRPRPRPSGGARCRRRARAPQGASLTRRARALTKAASRPPNMIDGRRIATDSIPDASTAASPRRRPARYGPGVARRGVDAGEVDEPAYAGRPGGGREGRRPFGVDPVIAAARRLAISRDRRQVDDRVDALARRCERARVGDVPCDRLDAVGQVEARLVHERAHRECRVRPGEPPADGRHSRSSR